MYPGNSTKDRHLSFYEIINDKFDLSKLDTALKKKITALNKGFGKNWLAQCSRELFSNGIKEMYLTSQLKNVTNKIIKKMNKLRNTSPGEVLLEELKLTDLDPQ